jgi:hypothetical protein
MALHDRNSKWVVETSAALWIYRHLSAYICGEREKNCALINIKKSAADEGGGKIMALSKNKNKFLISCCFFQARLSNDSRTNKKLFLFTKSLKSSFKSSINGDKLLSRLIMFLGVKYAGNDR